MHGNELLRWGITLFIGVFFMLLPGDLAVRTLLAFWGSLFIAQYTRRLR